MSFLALTFNNSHYRHVPWRSIRVLIYDQQQLPPRATKGQVHANGTRFPMPRVHSMLIVTKIYHPNVDLEGNVCLNILREDWKPVLNLNSVMVGLQYLFLEPNADDPLNKGRRTWSVCAKMFADEITEAAEELRKNRDTFIQNVKSSMRGVHIKGVQYAKVLVQ